MDRSQLVRVTVTLEARDVDLLDRLAKIEGKNRSAELRGLLEAAREQLVPIVEAFEAAVAQREAFDSLAAQAALQDLQGLLPEVEALNRAYLGAVSRIEGAFAADPRPSNHGGHTPTPPPGLDPETGR